MPQPPADDSIFYDRSNLRPPPKKSSFGVGKIVLIVVGGASAFFLLVCSGFILFVMFGPQPNAEEQERIRAERVESGEAGFDAADRRIATSSRGVAHGNSAAARELAATFSTQIQVLREAFFTKRKKEPLFSLSKGQFLTYCRLDDEGCVFLVHVPDLRKFTDDSKKELANLAWISAQAVVRSNSKETPRQLAVGIRGSFLYDTVLIGDFVPDEESENDGVKVRDSDKKLLYQFFKTAAVDEESADARAPQGDNPELAEPAPKN